MTAVVHIGYPKTASTTFQRACMSLDRIAYLGKGLLEPAGEGLSDRVLRSILCGDDDSFAEECPALRAEIEAFAEGRVLVVSDEALSFGTFMYRSQLWSREVDSSAGVVSRRLARLLPGFRLLVGLRRQDRLVCAIYRQRSKVGVVRSDLRTWFEEISRRPGFHESLDFHSVLRTYRENGVGELHAFDLSRFTEPQVRHDVAAFVLGDDPRALVDALDARHENPDLGRVPDLLRRALDFPQIHGISARIGPRFKAPLHRLVSRRHRMEGEAQIGAELRCRFASCNSLLEREFGVALR